MESVAAPPLGGCSTLKLFCSLADPRRIFGSGEKNQGRRFKWFSVVLETTLRTVYETDDVS